MTFLVRFSVIAFSLLIFIVTFSTGFSQATPAEVFVSWKADNSFVPADYPGKALPSPLSSITVKVGAFRGGGRVDLSGVTIRWFVDNYAVKQGVGMTEHTIVPSLRTNQRTREIKVQLLELGSQVLSKSVSIPIVTPEVVIKGGETGGALSRGLNLLSADPYYFSVDRVGDIFYRWVVAGSPTKGDRTGVLELTVAGDLSRGDRVDVGVTATSFNNEFDAAIDKKTYTIR